MAKIIAVSNQKGGVGKTTTVINLSASLAEMNKKVLAIDIDPQGNMTSGLGLDKNNINNTIYELLLGECSIKQCIRKTEVDKLEVLPANTNLAGAEVELMDKKEKDFILKNELDWIADDYDYIIIDCPPSLNIFTINAMTTADSVIIPIQCEYYALEGLSDLKETIALVKERLNENLHIEGVLFTMFDARTKLAGQVVENVRENLEDPIYNTVIPRNIRLAEAPSYGIPINVYDTRSSGAVSYRNLAEEIVGEIAEEIAGEEKGAE